MKPPVIYADCRCLQDARFRIGGVGIHAASLLRTRLGGPLAALPAVALVDPSLGPLPSEAAQLFDRVTYILNPTFSASGVIFLDLSPMTHEPAFSARFAAHPLLFKASVVYDFIPNDWPGCLPTARERAAYLSKLASLKTASRFFPISCYAASRLMELVGAHPADIVETGTAVRPSFWRLFKPMVYRMFPLRHFF